MASRFWVGGSGNWNTSTTTNWAATSGGAGGASAPTAADDVFFDASSGTGTTTIITGALCRSLNCTGFTGTISHPASTTLNIGDATAGASNIALKFVAGMTYTNGGGNSSIINFVSTSATLQDIDSGGKSMPYMQFNGAGGNWQLTSSLTTSTNGQGVNMLQGTFSTNNQTLSVAVFNLTGTLTRSVSLGSSVITLTVTGGNAWNASTTTNLTFNAGTSQIIIAGLGNPTVQGGGLTYNRMDFTSSNGVTRQLNGNNTFADLRFTNTGDHPELVLGGDQTVSTTLQFVGNNATEQRVYVYSDKRGAPRTITCNGTATLTNVDFTDITGAGTASWSGTSVGNGTGNSGITFTTPVTRYWVGGTGYYQESSHWSATSGGAGGASMPLVHDTAIFDANSFSAPGQSVGVQNGGGSPNKPRVASMNWTGVTNNPTFNSNLDYRQFGNQTFVAGMTLGGTFGRTYMGNGSTATITMAGLQWPSGSTSVNALGTITFADAFSSLSNLVYLSGTWNVTSNITVTGVSFNGDIVRTLNMGSGTWTVNGTSPWNGSSLSNMTLNAQTSTVKITDSSTTTKNFGFGSGGPFTYNIVWVATGNTGIVNFFQSVTYATFKSDVGRFIRFQASTTQTITSAAGWQVTGSAGNLITIDSSSAGSPASISVASGTVSSDYLSLKDSTATGGASFYAGNNSTNVSGNTGWIFSAAPLSWTLDFNENITITEPRAMTLAKVLSESIAVSESYSNGYAMVQSDNISATESVTKSYGLNQTEAITISEGQSIAVGKNINETVLVSEIVTKDAGRGSYFGLGTVSIDNFDAINIAETSYLSATALKDDTTITVKNSTNITAGFFALIGVPGSEESESIQITSVLGDVITLTAPLERDHLTFTQLTIVKADQVRIYRAESVDGEDPAIADYVLLVPVILDYDNVNTVFVDADATEHSRYKFSYYNSILDSGSSISDSETPDGTDVGVKYGDYCSIDDIKEQAGLQNNRYITDGTIDRHRKAAAGLINSTLSGRYVVPFENPINPLIRQVNTLLAAGYLLTQELGAQGAFYAEGQAMIDRVMNDKKTGLLDRLDSGSLSLVGVTGTSEASATGGNYKGIPNSDTTASVLRESGRAPFSVKDRY